MKTIEIKKERGITLIALVVTIIILLILASVSISLVVGKNGLITKAKEAKEKTEQDELNTDKEINSLIDKLNAILGNGESSESVKTENTEFDGSDENDGDKSSTETQEPEIILSDIKLVSNNDGSGENLAENSTNLGQTLYIIFTHGIDGGTTSVEPALPYAVIANGTYTFTITGTVNGETYTKVQNVMVNQFKAKTLVQAFNLGEIEVGDYLNYSDYVNVSNTYTSVTNENGWADQTYTVDTQTQWRVLGLNQNETQLMLMSASPIKKDMNTASENSWNQDPYLYMKGAYSYVNCKKILNDISAIYSTSLGIARSVTVDDINNILGVTTANDKMYYTSDATQTNIDLSVNSGWIGTYIYKETDYTPQTYINDKTNAMVGQKETKNGYWYKYTEKMSETIGNTTLGELLFDQTTSDSNYAKSYWLASPGVYCSSTDAHFGPGYVHGEYINKGHGLFYAYGNWHAYKLSVRPIVTLNSDLTIEQLQVIDGEVETWTYNNSSPNIASGDYINGEAGNHGT